jgi:hypothetical protein
MECDNNNDFDIASVKALDNKLCSEVCLPGEWQSAEHELGGRHPSALILALPRYTRLLPCIPAKKAWGVLRCWRPVAEKKSEGLRRVLELYLKSSFCSENTGLGRKGQKFLSLQFGQTISPLSRSGGNVSGGLSCFHQ